MTDQSDARGKIELLRGLRQVRAFSLEPVPEHVVSDILEVARWTGSAVNRQPWEFVVVQNRETLRAVAEAEAKGSHLAGAVLGIVIVMQGERKESEAFDEARLAERMLLAAAVHGVAGGIWWFKDGGEAARHILGIPPERQVRTAISFGFPPAEPSERSGRPGGRKPLSEIVHREKY